VVSELFAPDAWRPVEGFEFTDITYHRALSHGTVRVAFNRPEVRTRSGLRPLTSFTAPLTTPG
jgi:naphthoate synthase